MAAEATIVLKVSAQAFNRAVRGVRRSLETLKRGFIAVGRAAKQMFIAATVAATAFIAIASRFVKAAFEQEKAVRRLEAALRATDQYTKEWSRSLQAAASELQRLTIFGDEAILPVMALGLNMGIARDNIVAAMRAAIGLATVFDMQLEPAMRLVALALQGNFTMLSRYIPQLRDVQDEAEATALVMDFFNDAWQQAQEQATTAGGRMQQLKNDIGDVAEEIGFAMLPALQEFTVWARDRLLPAVREIAAVLPETFEALALWGTALYATYVQLFEFVIDKIKQTLQLLDQLAEVSAAMIVALSSPFNLDNWRELQAEIIKTADLGKRLFSSEADTPLSDLMLEDVEQRFAEMLARIADRRRRGQRLPGEESGADLVTSQELKFNRQEEKKERKEAQRMQASQFQDVVAAFQQIARTAAERDRNMEIQEKQLSTLEQIRDELGPAIEILHTARPAAFSR